MPVASVAKPVPRPRFKKPTTVSASALALHLDCSRIYLGKLEAEGVIQRQGDGFPLDQSRVVYLPYLRRERRLSPRAEADADHVRVKTEMLQLRLMEKKQQLLRLAQQASKPMRQQGCGRIIFTTSITSMLARAGIHGYVASKSGLVGLTRSLACERGQYGIRCSGICPGYFETELTSSVLEELSKTIAAVCGGRQRDRARR